MTDSTGSVLEAQVDWLTCSAHGRDSATRLLDLANHLGRDELAKGKRKKRWRMMGYEGTHIGQVEYGQRDQESTILRLIGDSADQHLTKALSASDEVTRLDIAVTWRADPPDPQLGPNAYTLAELFHRRNPQSALPRHTQDAKGGYTLYIGSRTSDNFFRLYNKEAECLNTDDDEGAKRYSACWRYELEVKAGLSKQLAERVNDTPNRPAYVQRYVYEWCQAHGVEPSFGQFGGRLLLPGFRRRSDAESRLRHITRNVRPTVEWLRQEGHLAAALDALGLYSYLDQP